MPLTNDHRNGTMYVGYDIVFDITICAYILTFTLRFSVSYR